MDFNFLMSYAVLLSYSYSQIISNLLAQMMFLNCGVGEDAWESLGLQGDPTSPP